MIEITVVWRIKDKLALLDRSMTLCT